MTRITSGELVTTTRSPTWATATSEQILADIHRVMTELGVPETQPPVLDKRDLLSGVSILIEPWNPVRRSGI